MDIRKLEAFYYVFKTGSFSKAGEEIFLSQPTVSTHISALEKELGVKLFDRNGRNALPTPAGRLLFARVQELFELLRKTKQEIGLLQEKVEGEVFIGASTIPATYLLPPILAAFLKEYSQVSVNLEVGDSLQIWNKVLEGEVDFGITGGLFEDNFLCSERILEDDLILVANPDLIKKSCGGRRQGGVVFPVANPDLIKKSQVIDLESLKNIPWVMREKGSGTRKALEQALAKRGIFVSDLKINLEVKSTEALVQYVLWGTGIGFTSRLVVQNYLQQGRLKEIKVKDLQFSRNFYLIWHPKREVFPLFLSLKEFIKEKLKDRKHG